MWARSVSGGVSIEAVWRGRRLTPYTEAAVPSAAPAPPPHLSRPVVLAGTALVMAAFAANSVLARLAADVDAATLTAVRLGAGALTLWAVARLRRGGVGGSWASTAALFVYAAASSFAYFSLPTGTGALLLFGAMQVKMIGAWLAGGERLSLRSLA